MIRSKLSSWREYLTPVSHKSSFQKTGQITPEEFVAAGDYLVYKFPTWSWGSASPSKQRDFLPANKQYLVTKHVPCRQRANGVGGGLQLNKEFEVEDDWMVSAEVDSPVLHSSDVEEGAIGDADLADLEEADLEEADLEGGEPVPTGDHKTTSEDRTYNVFITYSTSYRVPKIYLSGFDDNGAPLPPKLMFEDILGDYKDKTVTIEPAPFLDDLTLISIHPCRHAGVMRMLLDKAEAKALTEKNQKQDDDWEEFPAGIRVDQYLIIFLKFIASVTPTIEHDFTMTAL
ncbi:Autophagy-related protein 3 [Wickerhamiella sorbophila]|uniref:Autophagy-related protein 3 n=1 Tax=Wickerhamiella sorbophila TaxID=45607 RepID=A0A2T0FNK2_9ASCO|nr:Autophagy-related protein 3 [Wickerhamiella sorbophila]PRT56555.1 Autophagy-related protein 3 [Wickerhamiella sorbophila]